MQVMVSTCTLRYTVRSDDLPAYTLAANRRLSTHACTAQHSINAHASRDTYFRFILSTVVWMTYPLRAYGPNFYFV